MKKYKKILALLLAAALLPIHTGSGSSMITGKTEAKAAVIRASLVPNGTQLEIAYNTNVSDLKYVTPVEDQKSTNYCWAYMANAVLESYLKKTQGIEENFSESKMIADLSISSTETGGNYKQALAYWTRGEKYGPYSDKSSSLSDIYVSDVTDLGAYKLDSAAEKEAYLRNIKYLVKEYGAVGVSVDFPYEERAAYTSKEGAYYKPLVEGSPVVNHGVTIVGWNDAYAASDFSSANSPQSNGAFLVKNSWGLDEYSVQNTSLQNTGYFWMSYENYFTDAFAITGVTSRNSLYDTFYESDADGLKTYDTSCANNEKVSYTSMSYSKKSDAQYLTAVATYVRAGCSYKISVMQGEQPVTELKTSDNNVFSTDAYHVFYIQNPIQVAGTFNITIEVTNQSGESINVQPIASDGNACIKAYTKEVEATVPSAPTVMAKTSDRVLTSGDWVNEAVTFTVTGGMDNAVYEYAVGSDDGDWISVEGNTFVYEPEIQEQKKTIYVRAKNPMLPGLVSPAAQFEIGYETRKPVITAASYETRTDAPGVIVHVTGIQDTISGLAGYYISEENKAPTAGAAWTELASNAAEFSFYSEKDTTYYIWVKDRAGNISECESIRVEGAVTIDVISIQSESEVGPRGSIVRMFSSISGRNNPSQAVTWSLSGARDADTSISQQGELTIGCNESAEELIVSITSAADTSKTASYKIIPTGAQSVITQISITPASGRVQTGGSQTFRAVVYGTNQPAQLVTWNMWGSQASGTYISDDGTLYVASNETADILYIRAASKLDSTKSETVSASIGRSYTIVSSSGTGGFISPLGSDSYTRGSSAAYTIRPYNGYRVADVLVDGTSVLSQLSSTGSGTSLAYTYTFRNITQAHTITASFTTNTTFTVTFISDGRVCKTEQVDYGGSATAPVIYKDGYVLTWDRGFTNVTSNLTVNAVWMYDLTGGSNTGSSQNSGTDSGSTVGKSVETLDKMIYVLNTSGNASFRGLSTSGKNSTKLVVPNTVNTNGKNYKVISLGAGSFKRNTKVRSVTVGKNIKKIGSTAFYGCKNLRRVTIKSTKVTSIGSRAFQGISKDAVIYVPRSCLTKYRSLIRSSGNKTVRVRAYD